MKLDKDYDDVFIQQRSTSATLHACATQPRGVNGASASKTSLIEPRQASPRCATRPARNCRASVYLAGFSFRHAST